MARLENDSLTTITGCFCSVFLCFPCSRYKEADGRVYRVDYIADYLGYRIIGGGARLVTDPEDLTAVPEGRIASKPPIDNTLIDEGETPQAEGRLVESNPPLELSVQLESSERQMGENSNEPVSGLEISIDSTTEREVELKPNQRSLEEIAELVEEHAAISKILLQPALELEVDLEPTERPIEQNDEIIEKPEFESLILSEILSKPENDSPLTERPLQDLVEEPVEKAIACDPAKNEYIIEEPTGGFRLASDALVEEDNGKVESTEDPFQAFVENLDNFFDSVRQSVSDQSTTEAAIDQVTELFTTEEPTAGDQVFDSSDALLLQSVDTEEPVSVTGVEPVVIYAEAFQDESYTEATTEADSTQGMATSFRASTDIKIIPDNVSSVLNILSTPLNNSLHYYVIFGPFLVEAQSAAAVL